MQRHSRQPISQDDYDSWRASPVTQRLFDTVEIALLESFSDEDVPGSIEEAAINELLRKGGKAIIDSVLSWSPAGCKGPDDED